MVQESAGILLQIIVLILCGVISGMLGYITAKYRGASGNIKNSTEIEQLNASLQDKTAELKNLQTEIVSIQEAISEYKIQVAKSDELLIAAKNQDEKQQSEIAILKSSETDLREKIQDSQKEFFHAKTQFETVLTEKKNLQERLDSLKERLEKSVAKAEQSDTKLSEILPQIAGLNAALKEKETQLAQEKEAQEKIVGDLRNRLAIAEKNLETERENANSLKDVITNETRQAKAFETAVAETKEKLEESKRHLAELTVQYRELNSQYIKITNELTKLKTELSARDEMHAREVKSFEAQKHQLAEQFKVLSNEILEVKTKTMQENSKLTLTAIMNPFQQAIEGFKKEVTEIHHRETIQQGELKKELETLKELNKQITTEAHALATALRGQKKLQGNWGELLLENILERSGLQKDKDYKREVSITTEEGKMRPDVIVYLPQKKHLVIDSKVSLNAYMDFVNAEDDGSRELALRKHINAVSSRIKELSNKDYYKLPGINSPEIVFMFIPIESAFVEALKADESLFQHAIENRVLVATPTTLLTSLNIIRQLWRYEDQNKHTALLASKADAVFNKLRNFLVSFDKIKKSLESAFSAYNTAESQLVNGKGNLVKQVNEFKKLAPAITGELPEYYTEKANLEISLIESPEDTEVVDAEIEEIDEKLS